MSNSGRRRIMVLGIGNPGRADDGVGALIGGRLAGQLPANVTLVVRSGDIVTLVDTWADYDALVCVDAANPMGQPGRVHRLEGADEALAESSSLTSSHGFGLAEAIALARELQTLPETVVIYAVEGACFDIGARMTPQVAKAAADVAERIIEEVDRLSWVEAGATM
ncbi:MAG: hydrogenase maturation protease [Bradyrhizobium sp.]|nr:hydrogenase maturation protease [Bradyrhizobium sp.]